MENGNQIHPNQFQTFLQVTGSGGVGGYPEDYTEIYTEDYTEYYSEDTDEQVTKK